MSITERTGLVMLASLFLPLTAFAQGADTPPTTPEGFVARPYDARSGEVAWQRSRDDRGVVGYEVTRDGVVLGTFDALSYVDRSFQPDTRYTFTVVAIDTAGQRSGTASVTLGTEPRRPGSRPGNPLVSTAVYSRTAAELSWNRPATPGLIYTVVRDGTLVYEGDATSYYDDGLSAGTSYVYDVQATDRQGRSSAITQVELTTRGGGGERAPIDSPAAPTGLRGTVYSASAAELFWDRSTPPGLSYEVLRDGELLGATDGTSFFDDTRPGTGRYRYSVVTVQGDARSEPATTTLGDARPPVGPDGPDAPLITADSYVDVLAYAFDIYTGKRFGASILALPGYPVDSIDIELPPADTDPNVADVTCENGGTLTFTLGFSGSRQTTTTRDYAFDNCQSGTALYDGNVVEKNFGNVVLQSSGIEVVDGPLTTRFSGGLNYMPMSNRDGGPFRFYGLGGVDLSIEGESAVLLSEAEFGYAYVVGNTGFEIDGGYRFASALTAGREVTVSTPEPLGYGLPGTGADYPVDEERPETVRFSAGVLRIDDANGDSLTLVADNGDPATADIEIVTGGRTERFVQPWSVWADALNFSFSLPTDR